MEQDDGLTRLCGELCCEPERAYWKNPLWNAPGIGQRAQNLGDDFCHLKKAIFGRALELEYTARIATLPRP